jgi:PIN domain nuclease of toxin-antitoxin system
VKYLLDTHVFLWTVFNPNKLSSKARKIIEDPDNHIYVSTVTYWEISLKYGLGKLILTNVLPDDLPKLSKQMHFETMNVDEHTTSTFYKLPKDIHKDPFDRLVVWQAINQKITLITRDRKLSSYKKFGLKTLWR